MIVDWDRKIKDIIQNKNRLYSAKRIERAREVLIRQVGDTRVCPHCGQHFIPEDTTSREALQMYHELGE